MTSVSGGILRLTGAQLDALQVLDLHRGNGCRTTSRRSRGAAVNRTAADSLHRLGLARIRLETSGEWVDLTDAGRAALRWWHTVGHRPRV